MLNAIQQQMAPGRTGRGVASLFAERAVSLVANLAVAIALTRHLGPDGFGLLNFVLAFAAIAVPISTLGMGELVTRRLLEKGTNGSIVLGSALALRKLGGLAVIAICGLYCLFGPFPDDQTRWWVFLLVAAAIIGDASVLRGWFVSHRKLPGFAAAGIIRTAFFAALKLAAVAMSAQLVTFVWIAGAELLFLGLLTGLIYLTQRSAGETLRPQRQEGLLLLSKSWPLAISAIFAIINLKIDVVLLGLLSNETETGLYSAAARLSEVWHILPSLLMVALFPALMAQHAKGSQAFDRAMQRLFDALAASATVIAVAVSLVAAPLVVLLFGEAYAAAGIVLTIHVWSAVFIYLRAAASKWMVVQELYVFSLVSHGVGALINIGVNLLLIPGYGATGAAVATLLSYATASWIVFAFFPSTRDMFLGMCRALVWPLRPGELFNSAKGLLR